MKRLKFRHPFCGRQYPILVCYTAFFASMMISAAFRMSLRLATSMMVLCPLLALVLCYVHEQHLTANEHALCNAAELPLWNTPSPELRDYIRRKETEQDYFTLVTMCLSILIAMLVAVYGMLSSVFIAIALLIVSAAAIGCYVHSIRKKNWADIDETAVCTVIPIDHIYEVKHYHRSRYGNPHVTYESYIVFYQPDGRYVLHATHGAGLADSVLIIKFRGLIRWLPYHTKEGVIQ